ncbi:MAG: ABC transporter permease [Ignavibacteriales bacterium]|nr:ABC transporter permease [Ignavibacteriales bacterium]
MNLSYFIAGRFLRSRRNRGFISFITFFAVVGITVGVAALIITLSILRGFENTIKENIIGFTAHLQIYGFQNQALTTPEASVRKVRERFPEVRSMSPYVSREAMIRTDRGIDGVLLKGIEPSAVSSPAARYLVKGSYDLERPVEGSAPVILGKRLAERLGVSVGDPVLVFALGGYSLTLSQTRIMKFRVTGIYETGMEEYDASYVYVHLNNAQKLFQYGNAVTGFDVLVGDLNRLSVLSREIPEALGYPHYTRTMFQLYRNLFSWIDLQKSQIPILLGLIIVVATVNIIGALLMMVMEKTKEIAVLRTLGATRTTVNRVFLLQGMFIGAVGTLLGNGLAYGLCWIEQTYRLISLPAGVYYMTHVPIELHWLNFGLVSGAALLLCYLCSLLPSRFAAKSDPVSLLRFAT